MTFNIYQFLYRMAQGVLAIVLAIYLARIIWVVFKK